MFYQIKNIFIKNASYYQIIIKELCGVYALIKETKLLYTPTFKKLAWAKNVDKYVLYKQTFEESN